MLKNQKNLRLRVLFNASVVLSGLKSPKGGSGKLLQFVKLGKIDGKISEVIYDEIFKTSSKNLVYQKSKWKKSLQSYLKVNL